MLNEDAVSKYSVQQIPNFFSKDSNARTSNASIMSYDMTIRRLSFVME